MEQKFVFKELQLGEERNLWRRLIKSAHVKKTIRYVLVGAVISLVFHYLIYDGSIFGAGDILKSIGIGAFFGFFITNSPCARGRC